MGFLSASSGFTRFKISDEDGVPEALWAEIPERLKKFAFKEIEDTAQERGWGWVCIDDMLDSYWRTAPPEKGAYLAFTFRLDTRRVAPAVLKKHLTLALRKEEEAIKQQGRKYIARDRKKEIKEQVRLSLMARAMPIPAVFDAVWNVDTGRVMLCCTQSKIADMFMNYFAETFELHLAPLTPYELALDLMGDKAEARLEDLEPTIFAS